MILADKIVRLRKKNGWSQEELAEKINVSRQAVSKWESMTAVPDLDKILLLAEVFGVTTDYLLKDSIEEEQCISTPDPEEARRLSLSEANTYLLWRKNAAVRIAVATALCILSVIPLLLFGRSLPAVGIVALLLTVAVAVTIYIFCGSKNASYTFIEEGHFSPEYGVVGVVQEKQSAFRATYTLLNIIGTALSILSPIPLIVAALSTENENAILLALSGTLVTVAVAVFLFVFGGTRWASFEKLLREGEYRVKTEKDALMKTVDSVYWAIAAVVYFLWSFVADAWGISWVVWPIAGVLFAGLSAILELILSMKK